MPTPMEYARAAAAAQQKGDMAAAAYFRQQATAGYRAESPQATEGMSGYQKFTAGMGQGAVNLGRQVGNLAGAVSDERIQEAAERDRPLLDTGAGRVGSFAGEVLATAPVGGLVAGAGKALGKSLLARTVGGGIGQGATEGFLTAGPDNRLAGAGMGAAGGAIIPAVGGAALRALTRGVNPTKAARRLLQEGVDLTPGQMNPSSHIGMLEETGQNLPGVGPMIKRARESSVQDLPRVVAGKSGAPGTTPGSVEDAYASFGPAYDTIKGFPTFPRIMRTAGGDIPLASFPQTRGAFEQAVRDPNVYADKRTRKAVGDWLQNKLTALKDAGKGPGKVDSADMLKLRSEIRDQIRAAGQGATPDEAQIALLRNAERSVTQVLESQLPPRVTDALRAIDKQYGRYKIFEDATRRAGDQLQGMSPSNLSAAVKAATPAGPYARGAGGPLRQLASSGKQVFDARTPPTGLRLLAPAAFATIAGIKPAALAALGTTLVATTKAGRKALAGRTAAQTKVRAWLRALRHKSGAGGRAMGQQLATATGAALPEELQE